MTNPVPGHAVTYPYGVRSTRYASGYHTGEDTACDVGTRIVAAWSGVVVGAGWGVWGPDYGYQVVMESTLDGIRRRHGYCHLSSVGVRTGQRVTEGQQIGLSGATGNITGPHLHYEERTSPFSYNNVDRAPYFSHRTLQETPEHAWDGGVVYVEKLHRGQRNSESVKRLKYVIDRNTHIPGLLRKDVTVDGDYGPSLEAAVQWWQRNVAEPDKAFDDGQFVSNAQANRLFGPAYRVVEVKDEDQWRRRAAADADHSGSNR